MAGPDIVVSRIERIEIGADYGKQPQVVSLATGTIAVVLDPRHLGLH